MSWAEVFLGIIAVATLVMAGFQAALAIYGLMIARKVARLLDQFEGELKPLIDSLSDVARDVARATSLAAGQVERLDQLLSNLSSRVEQTAAAVQNAVVTPLREGAAVITGVRAALSVLKDLTRPSADSAPRTEEEDPLFIG